MKVYGKSPTADSLEKIAEQRRLVYALPQAAHGISSFWVGSFVRN